MGLSVVVEVRGVAWGFCMCWEWGTKKAIDGVCKGGGDADR